MALQTRRGTDAQRQLITPLVGELIFATDTKKLYIGDGVTLGGVAVDVNSTDYTVIALDDLTDVVVNTPSSGQVLKFNGTFWVNSEDLAGTTINSIDDIGNVVINDPEVNQVLKYNGTNWSNENEDSSLTALALDDLTDIAINELVTGQVLKYNGTNWVNSEDLAGTAINSIDDIGDVAINDPEVNQVLKYNGTSWTNENEDSSLTALALDDLTDIAINELVTGQVLKYNGTNWVNQTDLSLESIGTAFQTGTHDHISFVYNSEDETIDASVDLSNYNDAIAATTVTASLKGSVVAEDNSVILNQTTSQLSIDTITSASSFLAIDKPIRVGNGSDLTIVGPTSGTPITTFSSFSNAAYPSIRLSRSRGTAGTPLSVVNNDGLISLNIEAHDGTNYLISSAISSKVTGTVSTGIVPSTLDFSVTNQTGNFVSPLTVGTNPIDNGSLIELTRCNGSTISPSAITAGQSQSVLSFKTYDGTNYLETGNIFAFASSTVSTGIIPTTISFNVMDRAGVLRTALSLNDYGTVNINRYNYEANILNFNQTHDTADSSNVSFFRARGTQFSPTSVIAGDELAEIVFWGQSGSTYYPSVAVDTTVTSVSGSNISSVINVTMNNGTAAGIRFVLESNGVIDFKQTALVPGSNPGEVNTSAPVNYMRVKLNGVQYAMPLFAINP